MITLLYIVITLYLHISSTSSTRTPLYVFSQVMSLPATTTDYSHTSKEYKNIETLLSSEIHIAKCQASCIKNFSPCSTSSSCTQCKRMCRLLEETPAWSNICSAPGLCKPGCQIACMSAEVPRSARHIQVKAGLWQIMIKECRLVWRIQDTEYSRDSGLMFLVAAKDKQGMFYHVGTVSASYVEVARDILRKAEKLIILSISEDGIQERHQVQVEQEDQDCGKGEDSRQEVWSSQSEPLVSLSSEETTTMPIIILSIVASLLAVALVVLVRVVTQYCRQVTNKTMCMETDRNDDEKVNNQINISEARDDLDYYVSEWSDQERAEKTRICRSDLESLYISRSV